MLAERSQHLEGQFASLFPLDLQLGLLAEPGEGILINALNRVCRARGQGRHRRNAGQLEAPGLVAAHTGYEAKVVILPPAQLADIDPSADAAVVDGIGIGLDASSLPSPRGGGKNHVLEAALDASVVRAVVLEAELFLGVVAEDQGEVLGIDALEGRQLLAIDAALQDGRRLRLPR